MAKYFRWGSYAKIEAAADSGIKRVIIPRSNLGDVVLEERYQGKIEIIPVDTMDEVLENALVGGIKKENLLKKLSALVEKREDTSAGSTSSSCGIIRSSHDQNHFIF